MSKSCIREPMMYACVECDLRAPILAVPHWAYRKKPTMVEFSYRVGERFGHPQGHAVNLGHQAPEADPGFTIPVVATCPHLCFKGDVRFAPRWRRVYWSPLTLAVAEAAFRIGGEQAGLETIVESRSNTGFDLQLPVWIHL